MRQKQKGVQVKKKKKKVSRADLTFWGKEMRGGGGDGGSWWWSYGGWSGVAKHPHMRVDNCKQLSKNKLYTTCHLMDIITSWWPLLSRADEKREKREKRRMQSAPRKKCGEGSPENTIESKKDVWGLWGKGSRTSWRLLLLLTIPSDYSFMSLLVVV